MWCWWLVLACCGGFKSMMICLINGDLAVSNTLSVCFSDI
jgi:hypothetical protein